MVTRVLHSGGHVCLAGKALDSALTTHTQKKKIKIPMRKLRFKRPRKSLGSLEGILSSLSPQTNVGEADLVHNPSSYLCSSLTVTSRDSPMYSRLGKLVSTSSTPTQCASALAQ